MVRCVQIELAEAEKTLRELLDMSVVDQTYKSETDEQFMYIPVVEELEEFEIVDRMLTPKQTKETLREALAKELREEELDMLKTAYDLVGDIAILEIDEELRHRERLIGETLLEQHANIHVVVRKDGAHVGELRLQEYKWLAGEERFETTVIENGLRLTLDIRKTYYSVRSANERMRIAGLVQEGERVLIMFSGIGPFVCVVSKHSAATEVLGVELNVDAHGFAASNIEQNKLLNASVVQGDVREVVPDLGVFDRICMPLPHTAHDFLDTAVPACKPGGMVHLYHFSSEEEVNAFAQTLPDRILELGRAGIVQHIQKCGNLGPGIHRWCLDIEIE